MKAFIYLTFVVFTCNGISGSFLSEMESGRPRAVNRALSWYSRVRRQLRPTHHIINPTEDCILMTSDEGEIFFRSPSAEPSSPTPSVCGIYMVTDPDKKIEVTFNYLDVPCDNGGLVAWVDGWELNGQVWPADDWDDDRVVEACDKKPKKKLMSRQNIALVQYRVPAKCKGFAITIRHLRNPKPCNVMLLGTQSVYTLRNHGLPGNCSAIVVSPATVRVLDLNVGQAVMRGSTLELETGTIHQCTKRYLPDYVDIGGASGLDHTKMEVLDSVCGLDSNQAPRPALIACEDTVVRLVSSGKFHNSVTVSFSSLASEDIETAGLICGMNDI